MIINDQQVGDKRMTTEWNPYNPKILDEVEGTIVLDKIITDTEDIPKFMRTRLYGYGSSIEKYLRMHPDDAQEQLLDWLHNKDELLLLHWLWRILSQFYIKDQDISWQMPEDIVKSFNITDDNQDIYLSENDSIFIKSVLNVKSIHNHATNEDTTKLEVYHIHSLKAFTIFILYQLNKDIPNHQAISYNDVCQTYVNHIRKYLNILEVLKPINSDKQVKGYLSTGKYYEMIPYVLQYTTFLTILEKGE